MAARAVCVVHFCTSRDIGSRHNLQCMALVHDCNLQAQVQAIGRDEAQSRRAAASRHDGRQALSAVHCHCC